MSTIWVFLTVFISNLAYSQDILDAKFCKLIFNKKNNANFLIKNGQIFKGPIDLGNVPISNDTSKEGYRIKTDYYVITSKNLFPDNPISNNISTKLVKSKSLCEGMNSYNVVIFWNIRKNETRPYKFSDELPHLFYTDEFDNDIQLDHYQFDSKVIANIVK